MGMICVLPNFLPDNFHLQSDKLSNHSILIVFYQLHSYQTDVPKFYPEDKRKAHEMRFEEVKEQEKKNFTTSYGPLFKKSNHPLAIMVR